MKKLLVLLILCCPFIIKAQDIDNYYINATINSNGDLLVEEYIETKEENGYFERDIYYQDNYVSDENALKTLEYTSLNNGSSVEFLTVGSVAKTKKDSVEFTGVKEFNKVNVGSLGDTGIYLLRSDEGKEYIRLYKKGDDAYYLKYIIKDLAVKHNDIGEIYFNLIKNNKDNIKNLKVVINLPDNKKAYAFSEGAPVKKIINNNYKINYLYKNVLENQDIKLRVLFDKDLIKSTTKLSNIEALNKIINTEKKNNNSIKGLDNFLEIAILVLVIINYMLLVNYTHKGLLDYKKLSKISKEIKNKKACLYGIIGIFLIIILGFLKLLGIVLLLVSIIVTSYMINKSKNDNRVKYIGVMYVLIMLICCFNLIKDNNIVYIILSIADMLSLCNLAVMEKIRKVK